MKIDARLVKQSVGMIVGGVIFAWSAMDKGRIDGIKEGKRLQAGWTVQAIETTIYGGYLLWLTMLRSSQSWAH